MLLQEQEFKIYQWKLCVFWSICGNFGLGPALPSALFWGCRQCSTFEFFVFELFQQSSTDWNQWPFLMENSDLKWLGSSLPEERGEWCLAKRPWARQRTNQVAETLDQGNAPRARFNLPQVEICDQSVNPKEASTSFPSLPGRRVVEVAAIKTISRLPKEDGGSCTAGGSARPRDSFIRQSIPQLVKEPAGGDFGQRAMQGDRKNLLCSQEPS